MTAHAEHAPRGSKQHARRRDHETLRPLWVYDDEDWELMRSLPTGTLICPEPGCRIAFNRPATNKQATRWLVSRDTSTCGHVVPRPELGGGSMSAQHRWLEKRLARVCAYVGYAAVTEHGPTYSDVFVPSADFSLEVQRWSTAFRERTRARLAGGRRMIWFLTEDAKGRETDRALFTLPAARLAVVSRQNPRQPLEPWNDGSDADAILQVYATVAVLDRTGRLETRRMDGAKFIDEILSGRRSWYPPGTPGAPRPRSGFWARPVDLDCALSAATSVVPPELDAETDEEDAVRRPTGAATCDADTTTVPGVPQADPTDPHPNEIDLSSDPDAGDPPIDGPEGRSDSTPLPSEPHEDHRQTPSPPTTAVPEPNSRAPWWRRLLHWLFSST